jgi:hypothetical protein
VIAVQKYMPEDLPMIDDNSDLTLLGYKNVLIEPQVSPHFRPVGITYVCCTYSNFSRDTPKPLILKINELLQSPFFNLKAFWI